MRGTPKKPQPTDGKTKVAWRKPALVAHGHIGKLTRGSSGTMTEGSEPRMCL